VAAGRLEESAAVAGQLVEAERVRFNAGDTDLLTVWLREQSFADAQKKAVEAWMDAWFARAELDAALGRGPEELRGGGG
jgi:outer membrane protein TolC